MAAVRVDATANRLRKAVIEFHDREYECWKNGAEEHAGLCRLDRTIDWIENAVAECAVTVQVVSDCDVEDLIEIAEFPVGATENAQSDNKQRRNNGAELDGSGHKRGTISHLDRKSTRLNSSHPSISYAVFC